MPTNRRRRVRERRKAPTQDWQLNYLLTGQFPPNGTPGYNPYLEGSWEAGLWERRRERLLSYWIDRNPGTRPFWWWKTEAPEPRLQISGTGAAGYFSGKEKGIPGSWIDFDPEDMPTFESEAAYLKRIGVLTLEEESRLSSESFKAVEIDYTHKTERRHVRPDSSRTRQSNHSESTSVSGQLD